MKLVLLTGLVAALATGAAAETYGLKAAQTALSGKSQAVIVAVPPSFQHPKSADPAAAVAGDWQAEFLRFVEAYKARTNVVVVDRNDLTRLFKTDVGKANCATVFVRSPSEAAVYDADCAPTLAVYEAGSAWMTKGGAPDARLHVVTLQRR